MWELYPIKPTQHDAQHGTSWGGGLWSGQRFCYCFQPPLARGQSKFRVGDCWRMEDWRPFKRRLVAGIKWDSVSWRSFTRTHTHPTWQIVQKLGGRQALKYTYTNDPSYKAAWGTIHSILWTAWLNRRSLRSRSMKHWYFVVSGRNNHCKGGGSSNASVAKNSAVWNTTRSETSRVLSLLILTHPTTTTVHASAST